MSKWNLEGSWLGASQGKGGIATEWGIAAEEGITGEGGSQRRGHCRGRGHHREGGIPGERGYCRGGGTSQGHIAREAQKVEIFFCSFFSPGFLNFKTSKVDLKFPDISRNKPSYFGGFNDETESCYDSNSMDELKYEIWYKSDVQKLNGPIMISFAKRNKGNPPHNEIPRDRIKWCDVRDSTS